MENDEPRGEPIRKLKKSQRRVLGVLLEKAFTTPEAYPLTLKAATTGCNQKSNRDPVTNYTEDAVLQALDELRELGVVAVIHTETGRTERYRHLMRKRFDFSEQQLAILTELWLRGRQQIGELRTRASRMVAIDSLEQLRDALTPLLAEGYVQTTGPIERRGVEVDHGYYLPEEGHKLEPRSFAEDTESEDSASAAPIRSVLPQRSSGLEQEVHQLRLQVEELVGQQRELRDELEQLKRSLGV